MARVILHTCTGTGQPDSYRPYSHCLTVGPQSQCVVSASAKSTHKCNTVTHMYIQTCIDIHWPSHHRAKFKRGINFPYFSQLAAVGCD